MEAAIGNIAIELCGRRFFHDADCTRPLLADLSLHSPCGSRCLLPEQNGAGKTTLLRVGGT